jgi:hypothetical protein
VTIAILVVCLIALLITLCKIEGQAGLPIITALIAFVIGQGPDAGRGGSAPVVFNRPPDHGSIGVSSRNIPERDSDPHQNTQGTSTHTT